VTGGIHKLDDKGVDCNGIPARVASPLDALMNARYHRAKPIGGMPCSSKSCNVFRMVFGFGSRGVAASSPPQDNVKINQDTWRLSG
jgi:hypothetical protein